MQDEVEKVMDKPRFKDADEVLEYAAREIEDIGLADLRGVISRRKRAREDAELRVQTIKETRAKCAAHLRAMMNRPDLEPRAILERIADREGKRGDGLLRDAWPLAWKGLFRIEVRIVCSSNSIPPEAEYFIFLTEKGRALLADQSPSPRNFNDMVDSPKSREA